MSIRVLIVDDHPVVRAGLRAMMTAAGLDVVGEAGDGEEAVLASGKAEVVLMDLQMPKLDGVAATRRIKLAHPGVHVVILTTFETEADVMRAVQAGALGYLLKDAAPATIVDAVRAAADGRSTLAPAAVNVLMARTRTDAPSLSRRELEVLQQVAKGASNAEAARTLRISEATVKTHLLHVFEKLGVTDRTAAVTAALERKLFRL